MCREAKLTNFMYLMFHKMMSGIGFKIMGKGE